MRLSPLSLNHVGVTVPDIFAALVWYAETLGLTPIMQPRLLEFDSEATQETHVVFGPRFRRAYQAHLLTGNGVGIELFQFVEPEVEPREEDMPYWRRGPFHLCLTHPDVGALAARIAASGGRQRTPVLDFVPGKPWQLAYCEDPWGTIVEIISHSYAEIFANWPQPGMTVAPVMIERPQEK